MAARAAVWASEISLVNDAEDDISSIDASRFGF
jgi:hypothetical protein